MGFEHYEGQLHDSRDPREHEHDWDFYCQECHCSIYCVDDNCPCECHGHEDEYEE